VLLSFFEARIEVLILLKAAYDLVRVSSSSVPVDLSFGMRHSNQDAGIMNLIKIPQMSDPKPRPVQIKFSYQVSGTVLITRPKT